MMKATKAIRRSLSVIYQVASNLHHINICTANGDWDCSGTTELHELESDALIAKQDKIYDRCDVIADEYEAESEAVDKEDCDDEAVYAWGDSEDIDLSTLDDEFSEDY